MTFLIEELQEIDIILNNFKKAKSNEEIFYNMCFCICIPQTKFSSNLISIQNLKNVDFYNKDVPLERLKELIKKTRFKNRKSQFLIEFKKNSGRFIEQFQSAFLNVVIKMLSQNGHSKKTYNSLFWNEQEILKFRNQIVQDIKGIGMKTASHFLRNMGFDCLAIVDTHIKKFLGIGNKFNYLEVEEKFRRMAENHKLSVAQLDALIWKRFSKTKSENFVY